MKSEYHTIFLLVFTCLAFDLVASQRTNGTELTNCQLAKLFKDQGESMEDISHWVCIGTYTSGRWTNFYTPHEGGAYYGIFQAQGNQECFTSQNRGLCQVQCMDLLKDPVLQVKCAIKLRNQKCFWGAWPVWEKRCHHNPYLFDPTKCFEK